MRTPSEANERDIALCRSILYEALSIGLGADIEQAGARLAGPEAAEALARAARVLDEAGMTSAGDDPVSLEAAVRALREAEDTADTGRLAASRLSLFGHTARGAAPPYETEYGEGGPFQKPQELADIAGFYGAFGLAVDPGGRERLDHAACETEFLAFMARKEALAIERGDAAMLEITRGAVRSFLKDHLARFGPAFAARLRQHAGDGFYGRLGLLLDVFLKSECGRCRALLGAGTLRLRAVVDDGAPIACASAPDCGAAEGCPPAPADA